MNLTIVTAVDPDRADFLSATAESVAHVRAEMDVEWIVVWDGDPSSEVPDATTILQNHDQGGISCARNLALAHVRSDFVTVLDADDLVVPEGCRSAASLLETDTGIGWVGLNRTLLDGTPTRHWRSEARRFRAGELAEAWTAPFFFHPNSVMLRSDLLLQVGGWPAVASNEDLGMVLQVSELMPGCFDPQILTRYRTWTKQTVAQKSYGRSKVAAFGYLEATINAKRRANGRLPVRSPENPGEAFGIQEAG